MTKQKLWIIFGILAVLILTVFSLNFYFISYLNVSQNSGIGDGSYAKIATKKFGYMHQLQKRVRTLKPIYLNQNPQYYRIRNKVSRNFEERPYENVSTVWDISFWVSFEEPKLVVTSQKKLLKLFASFTIF